MNKLTISSVNGLLITILFFLFYANSALLGQQGCDCLPGSGFNVNGGTPASNGLPNPYTLPCLNIGGTLLIDQPFQIIGTQVYMEAGSKIEVGINNTFSTGSFLSLSSTYFTECQPPFMWEGIVVNQNSSLADSYSVLLGANITISGRRNASIILSGTVIASAVQGISCEDCASVYATSAAIQSSTRGIHAYGNVRDADVVYTGGFLQTDQSGILINHAGVNSTNIEISDNRPVRVGNNSVGNAFAAIYVSNSNYPGSSLKINDNEITTLNSTHGILVFQSPKGQILNNDITIHLLDSPENGFKARGISVWNSDETQVINNVIQDPLNNQFGQPVFDKYDESSTGIFMSFSRNCLVMDNTMNETVIGMKVAGFCDHPASSSFGINNHIRNNSFVQPHPISQTPQLNGVDLIGLWYAPDALTGQQECTGNQWFGEFVFGALCQSNPLLSLYTVPSNSPPLMPPNVSPPGWFTPNFCKPAGEQSDIDEYHAKTKFVTSKSNKQTMITPNPASNMLFVTTPLELQSEAILRITDLAGKLVFESNIPPNNSELTFDISRLNTGIYLVQITNDEFIHIEKICVNK